jgi:hypothetical protein
LHDRLCIKITSGEKIGFKDQHWERVLVLTSQAQNASILFLGGGSS